MMKRAVVLLSGGQDSTTCLFWVKQSVEEIYALTLHYGQRHDIEIIAARAVADKAGVKEHKVIDLRFMQELVSSALLRSDGGEFDPIEAEGGIPDTEMPQGLPTSFVPGRNMLFLAAAASYAVNVNANTIVTGVCQTDYSGYPDCRQSFITAMGKAIDAAMPTSKLPITIVTPLMNLSKAQSVKMARKIPGCWDALAHTVTCYRGQRPGCGECPACVLRARGFTEAGEEDPMNSLWK